MNFDSNAMAKLYNNKVKVVTQLVNEFFMTPGAMTNMQNNMFKNYNQLLDNPNFIKALQASQQNQASQNQSVAQNSSELFRQYATALSGPELADPNKPENSLNLPHNKAMMQLFQYAQNVGVQPQQLAQLVRPAMSQAMQQSGWLQQMQGKNREEIMQQVTQDPKFLKTLENVFQTVLQQLQRQYGQNQTNQPVAQQQYAQPQNVSYNQSWTQGLANLASALFPNGIPTK